jgi:hypothetical protein
MFVGIRMKRSKRRVKTTKHELTSSGTFGKVQLPAKWINGLSRENESFNDACRTRNSRNEIELWDCV